MSLNTIGKEALEIYFMATNIIYTFQLQKKILKKMQKREKKADTEKNTRILYAKKERTSTIRLITHISEEHVPM